MGRAEEPRSPPKARIIGRSSSSFTRIARMFAAELGIDCELHVVRDLMSAVPTDYGDNPALKLPVLQTSGGAWFGALNICRELSRMTLRTVRIVWPEELLEPLLANAQELTGHALATEISLIMSKVGGIAAGSPHQLKMLTSLLNVLSWLDANIGSVLAALPADRQISYLEVTLFCLFTHLEFRSVVPVADYHRLGAFCVQFAERASARATPYQFDP